MPLQFALRLICHHLEHSFSAGCHKYTVRMRACFHPSLIMLLERSNWCLKAQPLWKHLGWHRGILLFSLFPTLISPDICCWLCLEPDCLKFLKLSQLFICRGEMRRAISKAMSTSIGILASIHEVRVYRRASRMPQPAGCTKTRLLVTIHYVCMTVLSCPAKDIAPMKTLPDARLNLKHLRNHFQRHQCSRVEPQSFMLRCFHCLKHRHWMLQLLLRPMVTHNTTLLLSWSPSEQWHMYIKTGRWCCYHATVVDRASLHLRVEGALTVRHFCELYHALLLY